ncbi:MAG: nucleoside triphosphate pyrophosphatase [Gammaproteobacteria bacterium]
MPQIILGSTSPYRAALMQRLRLPFAVERPAVDEQACTIADPAQRAAALARAKSCEVAGRCQGAIVIGADQVAATGPHVLEKPGDARRAREQLRLCSGARVDFHTAVCVVDGRDGACREFLVPYSVWFRRLSPDEIARYVDLDRPFDCAGSIRAEGLGVALFERMGGEDPTALVGLPLIALAATLRALGCDPLAQST